MSIKLEPIACFFDLNISEFDNLENTLTDYDIGEYVIAHESHNAKGEEKPHFHLFFEGTNQIYNNFSKKIIEKYGLRNKSGNQGGIRKYGKVKQIRDLSKMLSYTLKDKNFRSNMKQEKLDFYFKNSFKKDDRHKFQEDLLIYCNKYEDYRGRNQDGLYFNWKTLRKRIIQYYIINNITIGQSQLKSQVNYISQHKEFKFRATIDEIDDYFHYFNSFN